MASHVPTIAEFVAVYSEFSTAPPELVQAKLDLAASRTDPGAWGEMRSQGVMIRAADLLAKTPEGRRLRLVLDSGKSIYADDLAKMVRRASYGRGRVL